jgi:sec-independent protein translocase protein TatA
MGLMGPMHWIIVFVIVLLLFGNRLPSVMRSLGLGVVEFKKGLAGVQDEINNASKESNEKIEAGQTEATDATAKKE